MPAPHIAAHCLHDLRTACAAVAAAVAAKQHLRLLWQLLYEQLHVYQLLLHLWELQLRLCQLQWCLLWLLLHLH
jgi:hypothetical protein